MAAQGWQDELARRAAEGSARLREVLSLGLGFLRSELGLDLGLEPRRYPGWVTLVGAAALGLLLPLLLCYGWAAACAGARRKRRSPPRRREEAAPGPGPDDAGLPRSLRGDEPKKRSRKNAPDKPKVSDDDKEKGGGALPTGKSKKKRKKKKKQSEDNSPAQETHRDPGYAEMTEADVNPKAYPLADAQPHQETPGRLFSSPVTTSSFGKELTKPPKPSNRGISEFIPMAGCRRRAPGDHPAPSAAACRAREEKNVPYVFLRSKQALGRACGVSGPVLACSVTIQEGSQPKPQIQSIQQSIERLFVYTAGLCPTPH